MKPNKFKQYLLSSLIISACFASSFSVSALELREHSASYSAKIKKGVSIDGKATRTLKKLDGNKWYYSFQVDSFIADIKEDSIIVETKNTIKPLNYNYKLSAFLMSDRKRQVNFNWDTKTAQSTVRKNKWSLENIPVNTYDRLSYQLQLLLDVNQGIETPNHQPEMIYFVAHKGKLRESEFIILGEEVIETQFGMLSSVMAKKQRGEDAKRETYLWFSKEHPLLLLKMTQKEKDGEEYEIQLSSAKIEGKPINFKALK